MIKAVLPPLQGTYEAIGDKLAGMPDFVLSFILLVFAFAIGIMAVKGPPQIKPLLVAWVIL